MLTGTTRPPGSFCWFELATTDQGAAKEFYRSVFGWDAKDSSIGPGEIYTIFTIDQLDAAAAYTMRAEERSRGVPPHWLVYLRVESADAMTARAATLGGTVLALPFDVMDAGRMSVIQDPTGAAFALWEAKAHPGATAAGMNGSVVWADLSTPDQARAAEFYRELFGWKTVTGSNMEPASPGDYHHIVNGVEFIGGILPPDARPEGAQPHWLTYFAVADCDAAIDAALALDGRVLMEPLTMPDDRRFAVLADGQGAAFAVVENPSDEVA